MSKHERVRYEMLLRVRDFGKAHQDLFPESLSGHQALAAVTRAIEQIDAQATPRVIATRDTRRDQAARRAIILDRMRSIARTSRRVVVPSGAPLRLLMPKRRSDVAVMTAARTFLTQAEEHRDQFVSLGLAATWLTDLREALDAFEGALSDRRLGRAGVAQANAVVKAALASGSDAARILDVVVRNAAANDPGVRAAWIRDLRLVDGMPQRGPDREPETDAHVAAAPQAPAPVAESKVELGPLRQAS